MSSTIGSRADAVAALLPAVDALDEMLESVRAVILATEWPATMAELADRIAKTRESLWEAEQVLRKVQTAAEKAR